jgi:diguanylate cyclase (GGDEF)-like protein
VVLTGFAVSAAYAVLPLPLVRDILYNTFTFAAAIAVLLAVRLHRPPRMRPWIVLGLGMLLMSFGDWTWTVLERVFEVEPFPSLADVFYLSGVALLVVGVMGMLRGRMPAGDRAGMLDALMLATAFGVLSWMWVMGPMVAAGGSVIEVGVALAYPIADVALLGALARHTLAPVERTVTDRALVIATACLLVGDLGFAYLTQLGTYESGAIIDVAFLVAAACYAAAALHPSMRTLSATVRVDDTALGIRRMAILGTAALATPALLLVETTLGQQVDIVAVSVGTVVLFLLVLARLFLVVTDLRRTLMERQRLEAELKRQALHDPLTGLANRRLFGERLAHALTRRRERVAVLFVDLDDFKTINDTMGHAAGDQLLSVTASRLSRAVRAHDTAARLGGDEFALLLEDSPDVRSAGAVAERLLAALAEPLEIAERRVSIRGSIGISLGVAGSTDAEELMREADIAMYLAKGQGKGRYAVFEAGMHQAVSRGFQLRAGLEQALVKRQFTLHFQPIVQLLTGRPVGVEALLRWQHPERGLLPPVEFVPLAEATGLIQPIGRWVIEEASRTLTRLTATPHGADLFMSINVSPIQLADPELVPAVEAALTHHGIEPSRIVLELTETSAPDPRAAADAMGRLHGLGVRLAIDDFGSGYSSLGHLGELPVDIVKLDRAFIEGLTAGDRSEALASGIIQLGRQLGLQVVAEGIERHDQLVSLRALGCELGQGHHLAPPLPETELIELLAGSGTEAPQGTRRAVRQAAVGLSGS